jgi:small-conductance mechanosensitive channel
MLYFVPGQAGSRFQLSKYVFSMALIRNFRAVFLPVLILVFSTTLSAELDPDISQQVEESNAALTKVEKSISNINLFTLEYLKELEQFGIKIKSQTGQCIKINQEGIVKIDGKFELLGDITEQENEEVTKKRNSLKSLKQKHEAQLASCHLLILRSNALIETFQQKQKSVIASQLLSRNNTLLANIRANIENPKEGFGSLIDFVISGAGLDIVYQNRYLLSLLIVISVIGTMLFRKLVRKLLASQDNKSPRSFSRELQTSVLACTAHYILALLLTSSFAGYFIYFGLSLDQFPFIALATIGLFLYVLLTLILRVVLNPLEPAKPLTNLPRNVAETLAKRLRLLAKLLFVGFLIFSASNLHEFPSSVTGTLRNIYITLIILNLCWAFWLLGYIRGLARTYILRSIIVVTLLASLFADWAGYNNLANFIVIGISGSIIAWILTLFMVTLWTEFFNSLDDGDFTWQRYLRQKIGVQPGEYLPGSLWFRFVFAILVWSIFIIAILKIWGMSDSSLLLIYDYVIEGFDIGTVRIVPSKLIASLLVFAVLLSLVGWIKRRLQQNWLSRSRLDRGSKESMVSLTGYVGVMIVFLVSLSVAGLELANLALIAGALSIGIGFGLQNVVNNFISGIVLLFERPIKTGDWIIVGGSEGYVKKIQLRSTVIQTFDRADIIVPNSEIIASQVTNWMLNDSVGRIKVPVKVAYGTDPRLVEEILLKIANAHSMVVTRSPTVESPSVLFKEFGDSALFFELRCFITDIDYFRQVISEFNYCIASDFKEAGIEIPFPQADLHLKSSEISEIKRNK